MTNEEIHKETEHRPWKLPETSWKFYQEWNDAIFLHWKVDLALLRKLVHKDIEIDLFEGEAWVSLVAFDMENIKLKKFPAFPPVSNFHEINIRTYVKHEHKTGVYFLSLEASKKLSTYIAKTISELPYRYSKMSREENYYKSANIQYQDRFELNFKVGKEKTNKTKLDKWLTERYALFQEGKTCINEFEIHHPEWPIFDVTIEDSTIHYPRYERLMIGEPMLTHYSPGVQVLAWDKIKIGEL